MNNAQQAHATGAGLPWIVQAFAGRVDGLIDGAAAQVGDHLSCGQCVDEMNARGLDAVAVVDGSGRALGVVADADLRRALGQWDRSRPVCDIVDRRAPRVEAALAPARLAWRLQRSRSSHALVTDRDGACIGLVRASALPPLPVVAAFDTEPSSLAASKAVQPALVDALLERGLAPTAVQQLLGDWNRALYAGAVDHALLRVKEQGRGDPPARFALIAMGSVGRGECLLAPDQDNGLIYDDVAPRALAATDAWFARFARELTAVLAQAGFARCRGGVMASNALWRKPLAAWREQVLGWLRQREGRPLRMCDIFFDFCTVGGHDALGTKLRAGIAEAATHPHFLRALYRVDEAHGVALDLLGRLRGDPRPGPHRGRIHLKLTGSLPLVGAIRILALRERCARTGTLERMASLRDARVLEAYEHDTLSDAFALLAALLLRQQLADLAAGREPSSHVAPDALSKLEAERLADGLRAIRRLRDWLRRDLTAAPA